ncbi:protein BOLA4, chloroplastic/mitochondrial [Phragmites australis]|uniref:protein BOLA4, chloroplastic/mitochondrial n=1 Tax=Phragmites australis TaxID=29695 RepID=UPI002D780F35|nr:protein BOLA4, chloroplastic/mitochondrial [Phragmites australis]
MLQMRSAATAAPCSLATLLLRRLSLYSSSPVYSIRHHAPAALSSQSSGTWSPPPLSCSPRARGFSAWASSSGPVGPAESPATKALEAKIKEQLEADAVTVVDTSGDGRHVVIDVVSKVFEGKSAVNRQRMVYKAIWEELQSTVHAVDQMTTKTPAEAAANK